MCTVGADENPKSRRLVAFRSLPSDVKTFDQYRIGNDKKKKNALCCSIVFFFLLQPFRLGYFCLAWVPSTQYLVSRGRLIKLLMFLYALLNCNCAEV